MHVMCKYVDINSYTTGPPDNHGPGIPSECSLSASICASKLAASMVLAASSKAANDRTKP